MFQTRNDMGEIRNHDTLKAAFMAAKDDPTIWKISFDVGSERVRLVKRAADSWEFEPVMDIKDYLASGASQ